MLKLSTLLPFTLLVFCLITHAANTTADISKIQTQIQSIKEDLEEHKTNRSQLKEKLQQSETQLGDVTQKYKKISTEQKSQEKRLQTLLQQQAEYQKDLLLQQETLAEQIRAAYIMGENEYLRLLLNQQDPTHVDRNLTYAQYIAKYQLDLIHSLQNLLQKTNQNKVVIAQRTSELTALQNEQKQQLEEIKSAQTERTQALKEINHTIKSKDEQLRQLLADRAALENVIKKIEAKSAAKAKVGGAKDAAVFAEDVPTKSQSVDGVTVGGEIVWPAGGSFAKSQGKLSWPTRGKIIAGFSTPIEQSQIKLNAVLLAAPEGQDVHAIAPGRVVFADWMSGYGLLMIVDHGQGYMTLYGRNGSLFKKEGESVKPAERIATVGKTGGYAQSGLYFAIRKQGEPLNPQKWCR